MVAYSRHRDLKNFFTLLSITEPLPEELLPQQEAPPELVRKMGSDRAS